MVISGRAGEEDVFKALDLGAVDFIAKPTLHAAPELQSIQQELIRKVHACRDLRIDKVSDQIQAVPPILKRESRASESAPPALVIGASTGGPSALMRIFSAFSRRMSRLIAR